MTTNDSPTLSVPAGDSPEHSTQPLWHIYQALPTPLLCVGPGGTIESCNLAAGEVFGYDAGELEGRPVWIVCGTGCDPDLLVPGPEPTLAPVRRGELNLRCKSGQEFPADVSVASLSPCESGAASLLLVRDLSHERRVEAELERTYVRLAETREATRRRLSRELHDGPVQDLLGVSYRLARVGKALDELDGELSDSVDDVRSDVLDVINDLRGIIQETRPDEVASRGLAGALREHVGKLERNLGASRPAIELELGVAEPIPRHVTLCLYRAAQESITNALKHGHARAVRVCAWDEGESIAMTIDDDGDGFEVPADMSDLVSGRHFGLAGLAERVTLMGGTFEVRSERGRGSHIGLSVPRERRRRGRRAVGADGATT